MSKHLAIPASRLICLGDAKRATNATGGSKDEFDGGPQYNP